jgi:hypothetical protein
MFYAVLSGVEGLWLVSVSAGLMGDIAHSSGCLLLFSPNDFLSMFLSPSIVTHPN